MTNNISRTINSSGMRRQVFFSAAIVIITSSWIVLVTPTAWTLDNTGKVLISQQFSAQGQNNSKNNELEIIKVASKSLLLGAGAGVKPKILQVTILDNYAIADWLLGESGGTALLVKGEEGWKFVTPGGGVLNAASLQEFGVPKSTALKLERLRLSCIELPSTCRAN